MAIEFGADRILKPLGDTYYKLQKLVSKFKEFNLDLIEPVKIHHNDSKKLNLPFYKKQFYNNIAFEQYIRDLKGKVEILFNKYIKEKGLRGDFSVSGSIHKNIEHLN
ncbi:MAG: hypothetical protein ACTSW3_05280 [Promethearchaeota archaeon]